MKEKKKTAKGLTSCWFYMYVGCSDCLSFIFFDSESYLNPSKGREHLCSSFVSAFNVCLNTGLRGKARRVLSRRQQTGLINPVSFSSCSGFVCYSYKFLSAAQPKMFILPPVTLLGPFLALFSCASWKFPFPVLGQASRSNSMTSTCMKRSQAGRWRDTEDWIIVVLEAPRLTVI